MRRTILAAVPLVVVTLAVAGCAASDDDAPAPSASAPSPAPSASASPSASPSASSDEQRLDPYLAEIQSVGPDAYFAFFATVQPGEQTAHEYDLDSGAGSHVVRISCASVDGEGVDWALADPATGDEIASGTSACAQQAEPGESAPPASESSPVDLPGPVAIVVTSTGTVSGAVGLVPAG